MPDPTILAGQSGSEQQAQEATGQGAGGDVAGAGAGVNDGAWFDTLPEGLRAEKSLEAFKGKPIASIAESFVNAQKSFGSRLPVPLPTDKPEERQAKTLKILEALGRPPSPDKYAIKDPAYEEMGLQKNEASLKSFLSFAHKAGLTNEQVQEFVNWQAEDAVATRPDTKAAAEACIEALTKGDEQNPGWGSTYPKYIAIAKRTVDSTFPPGVRDKLLAAGFYNDPEFIRGLYTMGRNLIEDNILIGDENDTTGVGKSAQQELDALMGDPKGPYFNPDHAKHEEYVKRALDLRVFLSNQK